MRRWACALMGAALLGIAGCGQSSQPAETSAPAAEDEAIVEAAPSGLPPVEPALLAAPTSTFTAFEPSEIGVTGAPDIMTAIDPLIATGAHEEGGSLYLTIREEGDVATADVVRAGAADDSVSAGHLRIEFRREPEGWFPTNAYRRVQCARGALANQWTNGLCP
jgi:hypothetical protein